MGADVRPEGRVAVVCGVERLRGAQVHATDLRGGRRDNTGGDDPPYTARICRYCGRSVSIRGGDPQAGYIKTERDPL